MQTVSKTLEVVPLIGAGGLVWMHPNIIGAVILGVASIVVAIINYQGKKLEVKK